MKIPDYIKNKFMTSPYGDRWFYLHGPLIRPYKIPDTATEQKVSQRLIWANKLLFIPNLFMGMGPIWFKDFFIEYLIVALALFAVFIFLAPFLLLVNLLKHLPRLSFRQGLDLWVSIKAKQEKSSRVAFALLLCMAMFGLGALLSIAFPEWALFPLLFSTYMGWMAYLWGRVLYRILWGYSHLKRLAANAGGGYWPGMLDAVAEGDVHKVKAFFRNAAALDPFLQRILAKNFDINARDAFGNTALMIAGARGQTAIVKELLAHGAFPGLTNDEGQTALDLAREHDHHEIVSILSRKGHSRLSRYR